MDLTQLYGAVLDIPALEDDGGTFVGVESHATFGSERYGNCSSDYCGAARACVLVSPDEKVTSKGVRYMTYTTPHLADRQGAMLDRAFTAADNGTSGYGDFQAPIDVRDDARAMEALEHFRQQLGHTFLHPILNAYADSLVGPVPAAAS